MVKYNTMMWWIASCIPSGYSFFILPQKAKGKLRQIIFNKRGQKGMNWFLQVPDDITKHKLQENVRETLEGFKDEDKYEEFHDREYIKDKESGELRMTHFDKNTRKKHDRFEKKAIAEAKRDNERRKRIAAKKSNVG